MEINRQITRRQTLLIVFVLAMSTLMFELMISRMSVFYIDYANSFIAIPLTMFGLAIGSLRVHLRRRSPEDINIGQNLLLLTLFSIISFVVVFALFSSAFSITRGDTPAERTMMLKTLAFVLVFLPPFYYIGKILTTIYTVNRQIIGKLYATDLTGAALGCFITPLLFHLTDLPYMIALCLLGMTAVTAIALGRKRLKTILFFVALAIASLPALVVLESGYDLSLTVKKRLKNPVEIAHRWNEYSRVSLLRGEKGGKKEYLIIHNNAESNVHLKPFKVRREKNESRASAKFAQAIDRKADRVRVMFAGCGAQMIDLYAAGFQVIVGVEINRLVIDLAVRTKEIASFRIGQFLYQTAGVEMHTKEGRSFLDGDWRMYDLIYVASAAPTNKYKSGHSRKYLDTVEAMEAYLARMEDDGLLYFSAQPGRHKIRVMREVLRRRGIEDLSQHVIHVNGRHHIDHKDNLYFSLKPFTKKDIATAEEMFGAALDYPADKARDKQPHELQTEQRLKAMIENPEIMENPDHPEYMQLVTDDRPFINPLDFQSFKLFPTKQELAAMAYYRSWVKIATMIVVGVILLLIIAALYALRMKMPPLAMMTYLVLTGFCYMVVEIVYIAKLELFLESPLTSMALLLSIFLLTNALGSSLYSRYRRYLNMTVIPLVVGGLVIASLYAIEAMIAFRLGMPMPLKILLSALVVGPVGVSLGLFYPFVVTWLTDHDRSEAVPVTYGISTLSSVAGATYGMMMIINLGYANLFFHAAIGYASLTVLMVLFRLVRLV